MTRTFHINDNRIYKWLRSQVTRANDLLSFRRHTTDDPGLTAIWEDRKDAIEQIRAWLIETADTFIVIQGPRGSGKKELVLDQALNDGNPSHSRPLVIDCKVMQEARGDSATINAAAREVGYRPVFSWMNSISSLIDLAAQGTIGTKTGFSETLDTQLAKIWQNTATALKQIALENRKKDDKDAGLRYVFPDEFDTYPRVEMLTTKSSTVMMNISRLTLSVVLSLSLIIFSIRVRRVLSSMTSLRSGPLGSPRPI